MKIEVRFSDDVAMMRLTGKFLAGSDGPFLRQKVADLLEAGTKKLVIDFSRVPYIDSTGLGFLAGARKTVEDAGVRLVLASVNPHVKRVLDSVQLSQFFTFAESEAAALTALKEPSQVSEGPASAPGKSAKGKKRPTGSAE